MEILIANTRAWLKGILVVCPMGEALEDCPAAALRELPMRDRIALAESLTDDEVIRIIDHHRRCLKERESS